MCGMNLWQCHGRVVGQKQDHPETAGRKVVSLSGLPVTGWPTGGPLETHEGLELFRFSYLSSGLD